MHLPQNIPHQVYLCSGHIAYLAYTTAWWKNQVFFKCFNVFEEFGKLLAMDKDAFLYLERDVLI